MADKAKILAEIERLKNDTFNGGYDARYALDLVTDFINSLPEEPVSPCVECASISEGCKEICYDYNKWVRDNHKEEPVSEDLEEATKRAADETRLTKAKNGHSFFSEEDFNLGFSNGAQWDREKTISKVCEWLEERFADKCSTYEEWEEIRDDFLNEMNKTE